jgi:hypothetical protein
MAGPSEPGVLCTTCNFPLTFASWYTRPGSTDTVGKNVTMSFTQSRIENGKGTISFTSTREVMPDSFAYFTVRGPSENEKTIAKWDSLLFKMPLVPIPIKAEIYVTDRGYSENGGGIGDSIRIAYNRKFSPAMPLPNMVEVWWDTTHRLKFGLAKEASGPYTDRDIASHDANLAYWNNPADGKKVELDSVIVIYNVNFSKEIKTSVGEGDFVGVNSWATFDNAGTPVTGEYFTTIDDSIPPIVIAARYVAGTDSKCGASADKYCRDEIIVTLSEPVMAVDGVPDNGESAPMLEIPFAYKMKRKGTDFENYPRDLPVKNSVGTAYMTWEQSGNMVKPVPDMRDSVVNIIYGRYEVVGGDTSSTPMAGDSVKFAWLPSPSFVDLAGNAPNGKEWGREIEGENPFKYDKIQISELDPNDDALKKAIDDLLGPDVKYEDIFNDKKQVAILPVIDGWVIPSDVKKYYPGSLGHVFQPDVANKVPKEIEAKDITFHAKAYYHTNLGNYVTHGDKIEVKCDDEIFKIEGKGDCRSNKMAFYLAWNLKDSKDRWVGTGAYVEIFDFYWQAGGEKYDAVSQKIEMLGVKRIKSKK